MTMPEVLQTTFAAAYRQRVPGIVLRLRGLVWCSLLVHRGELHELNNWTVKRTPNLLGHLRAVSGLPPVPTDDPEIGQLRIHGGLPATLWRLFILHEASGVDVLLRYVSDGDFANDNALAAPVLRRPWPSMSEGELHQLVRAS